MLTKSCAVEFTHDLPSSLACWTPMRVAHWWRMWWLVSLSWSSRDVASGMRGDPRRCHFCYCCQCSHCGR